MSKLKLTLACGDYDFLRPLFHGSVVAPESTLTYLRCHRPNGTEDAAA